MKIKPGRFSLLAKLGKDKRASGLRLLARLIRDEEGSYLLYGLFILPVLIGVGGLAGEASLLFYNHRMLQSAADAAAYSAAVMYSNNTSVTATGLTPQAQAIVGSYDFTVDGACSGASNVVCVTVHPPITNYLASGYTAIPVSASQPQSAIFSSEWFPTLGNTVYAVAITNAAAEKKALCLLALAPTGTAIHLHGVASMDIPGCGVFSDSTDPASIYLNGTPIIEAASVGAAGGVSLVGAADIGPPPNSYTTGDGPITDPYGGTTLPTPPTGTPAGSCNSGICTPGIYSSGIQLKGGSWTLQPGIYWIEGGNFQTGPGGGGTTVVTGSGGIGGVTLVFTSTSTGMAIDSLSNVTLTAPTSGSTQGFVLMGDTSMPLNTSFSVVANATASLNGVVYLPNAAVSWQGGPSTGIACATFIVYTIDLGGNPGLNNSGCNLPGGGGGGLLFNSTVTLVQ